MGNREGSLKISLVQRGHISSTFLGRVEKSSMRGMECTTEMPIQPNMSVVPTCLWVGSSRIALEFGFRLWPHIIFSPIVCRTHPDFREDLGDAGGFLKKSSSCGVEERWKEVGFVVRNCRQKNKILSLINLGLLWDSILKDNFLRSASSEY